MNGWVERLIFATLPIKFDLRGKENIKFLTLWKIDTAVTGDTDTRSFTHCVVGLFLAQLLYNWVMSVRNK